MIEHRGVDNLVSFHIPVTYGQVSTGHKVRNNHSIRSPDRSSKVQSSRRDCLAKMPSRKPGGGLDTNPKRLRNESVWCGTGSNRHILPDSTDVKAELGTS